jgi:hypothetical protein
MRNLDLDYNVASFMRDMHEIKAETFKKGTIHSAFKKARIWPISCKAAIEKMKIYTPLENPSVTFDKVLTYLTSESIAQASRSLEKHTKIAKKQLLITLLIINRII